MTKEQLQVIVCGLCHDGIDVTKLSDQARREIGAAIAVCLELMDEHQTRTRKP